MKASEIMALAVERIDALMDAQSGTPEVFELTALAVAVQAYENETGLNDDLCNQQPAILQAESSK